MRLFWVEITCLKSDTIFKAKSKWSLFGNFPWDNFHSCSSMGCKDTRYCVDSHQWTHISLLAALKSVSNHFDRYLQNIWTLFWLETADFICIMFVIIFRVVMMFQPLCYGNWYPKFKLKEGNFVFSKNQAQCY